MNLFRFTKLPMSFTHIFKSMFQQLTYKHSIVFKWIILLHIILIGKLNLTQLARAGAKHITEWKFRRLLNAKYWDIHTFIYWAAREALMNFPPPTDSTIYAIVDGSTKDKRVQQAKKGKQANMALTFLVTNLSSSCLPGTDTESPLILLWSCPRTTQNIKQKTNSLGIGA